MMNKTPERSVERFITVNAFRGNEGLNTKRLATVLIHEAIRPKSDLKEAMRMVLSGNNGKMECEEVLDLFSEIFTGSQQETIARIRGDRCVGYSEGEEHIIITACKERPPNYSTPFDKAAVARIMEMHFPHK